MANQTPYCKYCNTSPFKTFCKSFFDHLETCRIVFEAGQQSKPQPSNISPPTFILNYVDNRQYTFQIHIGQSIASALTMLRELPYERVDNADKLDVVLNQALNYIPELSLAFDKPENPLHLQSKQYVTECLQVVRQKALQNNNASFIEEINDTIVDIIKP